MNRTPKPDASVEAPEKPVQDDSANVKQPVAAQTAPAALPRPSSDRSQVDKLRYVAPSDEQTDRIKVLRQSYIDLCTQIEHTIVDCQERSVAITHLRTAMFWTNAAIVLNGGRPEPHTV